jgi:hypothetical protein
MTGELKFRPMTQSTLLSFTLLWEHEHELFMRQKDCWDSVPAFITVFFYVIMGT